MRAALLPTPGDPFMLAYWLRNFETWRDEVDELFILVNGTDPTALDHLTFEYGEPRGIHWRFTPNRVGHDGAIRWLLENTEADHIVLCEDDAYVRRPEEIGRAFDAIEFGPTDIVGSPRHEDYASSPLQGWPRIPTMQVAELRRGLWPAFLFARRADLLATDRVFGDRRWNVGELVDGWRPVTPEDCAYVGIAPDYIHLDTLFGTTFQLRAQALRIALVHHVRLFDAEATEQWIAEDPPWFHITGLSTLDQFQGPGALPDWDDNGGLWARRAAWWRRLGIDVSARPIPEAAITAWDERFDRWALEVPA